LIFILYGGLITPLSVIIAVIKLLGVTSKAGFLMIKPSGASATKIDVTDLDSVAMESRSGLMDNGSFTADIFILESDSGQAAALAQFEAATTKNMKIVSPAKTRTFNTTCLKFPTIPDTSVNTVQTGSAEWQINGLIIVS
jgi:hypothetical protein